MGFLQQKTFAIENTSPIDIECIFHYELTPTFAGRDFQISPSIEIIPPHFSRSFTVSCLPGVLRKYEEMLFLDIVKYKKKIVQIPILADVQLPNIVLEQDFIDFGHIFIGYEYSTTVRLINDSDLFAKYHFFCNDDANDILVQQKVSTEEGVFEKRSHLNFKLNIKCVRVGMIEWQDNVEIAGKSKRLEVKFRALVTGPDIIFSTKFLTFRNSSVLETKSNILTFTNDSPIEAFFEVQLIDSTDVLSYESLFRFNFSS